MSSSSSSSPSPFIFAPTTPTFTAGGRPLADLQRRIAFLSNLVRSMRKRELAADARALAAKRDFDVLFAAFHHAAALYTCDPRKLLEMAGVETSKTTAANSANDADDEYYDQLVRMQERVAELKSRNAELTKDNKRLQDELGSAREEVSTKDTALSSATADIEKLRDQLARAHEDLEHERKSNEAADALLAAAYADHENTKQQLDKVKDERDGHELAIADAHLKLDSLRREFAEQQEKLAEQERAGENLVVLQRNVEELAEEIDDQANAIQDRDHVLKVKDARIAKLEEELQRALKVSRVAEGLVEAVGRTAEELVVLPGGSSLEAELGGIEEDEEEEEEEWEERERLELVGVIESASISIASVDVWVETREKETMTEVEPKPKTRDMETMTDMLEKKERETMTDISEKNSMQTMTDTAARKSDKQTMTDGTLTLPIIETKTKHKHPQTQTPPTSPSRYLLALLILLSSILYAQLLARNEALASCSGYARGAYGSPGYLLGVVPFGWDVGSGAWEERVGRWVAMAAMGVEEWVGVEKWVGH
ncbi:uncharacterized protein EI97DRAFT_484035 [Westerdykella ornata]|uniref:Uncharacterized protein n=1 Tax=Westerdykella ornata TaxID=318751 RepID=A0A6A6J7L4_WESOR|nr:uncharacterized protein EI97DRAFT_484035 [Westerdykella ornata]KAF2272385.1 hypothetical protein EI97DRAFT_484035 [Westerdykella ornata]